jgi:hypothetical protein
MPIREVFDLLTAARPVAKSSILFEIGKRTEPETVDFLSELKNDPKYGNERKLIDLIIFQLAHQPETSSVAIGALKEVGDPRVILENEKGRFEMATDLSLDEIVALVPVLAVQKDWLKKSFGEGAVFTLRASDGKLASVAVAHRNESNYSLYIDYVYTDENSRKKGHAGDMLDYLTTNHVTLECDLYRGNMLSEKVLKAAGFVHEGPGEKWVFRPAMPNGKK